VTLTEMTAAQHAVWFTEQAGVAEGAYRMALGIWFGDGLDEHAISAACAAVVRRHPLLSATVHSPGDVPMLKTGSARIPLTAGVYHEETVRELISRPFDLAHGPLARFTLLTEGPRHLLLVTAHHLIFDGVSKDILAHDLATAYNAVLTGAGPDLGSPSESPATEFSEDDLRRARAYWQNHWPAESREVLLPELKRVPVTAEEAATAEAVIPAGVSARIEAVAEKLGVTRFELILTAVQVLLGRYGNAGLPVTVALSTRPKAAAHEIGLHVSELPLAVGPVAGTVADFAHEVRRRLREMYSVRTVPLAQAVSGLRPSAALTPVSVSYRQQRGEPSFDGVESAADWSMHHAHVSNALSIFIVDAPAGLRILFRHSSSALPGVAAHRIAEQLSTVLSAIVDDPHQPVAEVTLLPPAERELLCSWNATERDYPAESSILGLFAAQVARQPEAIAVIDADRKLSYAGLDSAAGSLADLLREHGVTAGDLVAVSLPRSWQSLVSVLAVMRCGAAYVPVDPAYPKLRQEQILTSASPTLMITTAELAATFPPGLKTLTALEPDGHPQQSEPVAPDARAYVMYTSGSTGRPKGVEISHRALANLLLGLRDVLGSGPQDRWLALTSLSFDISGLELFLPLATGGQVVIASGLTATDGAAVRDLVRDQRVTHVQATPSAWRVLLDAGFAAPVVALAGGEALPLPLARELRSKVGRLFNVYGPTETTIWSTTVELPAKIDEVTIGRPIANTQAWLADPAGGPVPIGLPGELMLGGAGVAEGYLGQPELTAQRFGHDPVRGRWYRTGDLCRQRPDGQLVYLGRSDHQVKIRGHRIELGEIEAHLLSHPGLAQAVVVARGEENQLAAYVVGRAGPPDVAELKSYLAARLPSVMVPSAWMTLDRLPQTPNGKTDRRALPEPPRPLAPESATVPQPAPQDEITGEITVIWQEVLKIADIGPDEDLFDLGGHSLSITRISSRIHQRFGVQVPLDTFFDYPTIAEISGIVRQSAGAR
jgi:amino acid adenylation domain-containing protein